MQKTLSASTTKWSKTLKQLTGWHLKSSCEKPLEMISYCIIFETNIFIEMVICVAIDFKRDTRHFFETLNYWVGVQQGQSYLMRRSYLFSLDWSNF